MPDKSPRNPGARRVFAGVLLVAVTVLGPDLIDASAQTFVPLSSNLPSLEFGVSRWGDYDADGDLDLLMTGRTGSLTVTSIFANEAGVFTDIDAGLVRVYGSGADWGDYDNDNDLDLVVCGWDNANNQRTIVYRNDGGTFTNINAGIIGVSQGWVEWGDCDNDGDLDILLLGGAAWPEVETTRIYRNDGNDTFVQSAAVLMDLDRGCVDWGDYDNDGDLDILATGREGFPAEHSLVYRNDGGENFTLIDAGLVNLYDGQGSWGDYDSDGDLDILINGSIDFPFSTLSKIYRNDGNDTFTDINATLDPAGEGSGLTLGDCDNDGDLDALMSAVFDVGTDLYQYDTGSLFTRLNSGFTGECCGSHPLGDYDNDGDLDVMISLYGSDDALFRNDVSTPNTPPTPPISLSATVDGSTVELSWLPGTDNETASPGLTYNLRVGTTPGGGEVITAMADPATGLRLIPDFGNAGHATFKPVFGLGEGTYYWSVQTIDNGFAGSVFATQQSFIVGPFVCDCTHHGDVIADDGIVDVLDLAGLIDVVFAGAPAPAQDPQCPHVNRGDVNCDIVVNVLDIVLIIDYTFRAGPAPCDPCIL